MTERVAWEICPHCGRYAAVGWLDGIPVGFDCPRGCQLTAGEFARRQPRVGGSLTSTGSAVDVARRFAKTMDADASWPDGDLLPSRLARAAAAVLPVDGVGLCIHGNATCGPLLQQRGHRDGGALALHRGPGACMFAAQAGLPVSATEDLLTRRRPIFHDLLVTKTPLRSALAMSLSRRSRGLRGLDLDSIDPAE